MNIITAQIPLMAFIGDMPANAQKNPVDESSGDFLQQIITAENINMPLADAARTLEPQPIQSRHDLHAQQPIVPISNVLENLRLVNEVQHQAASEQPRTIKQVNEPIAEQSVVYLLHWLATGHLSHIASDLSATSSVHSKNLISSMAADAADFCTGLLPGTVSEVIQLGENELPLKQGESNPTDVDATEYESRRRSVDPAIFNEQISPYLKRRLIVSSQEDHTHVILRDYFLDSEDHLSELRGLLANIKQNTPGNIRVTINGHQYGDLSNY